MSFYVAFNDISSFLEMSEFRDSIGDNQAEVGHSIEDVIQTIATDSQTTLLPEISGLLENTVSSTDYSEAAAASITRLSSIIGFRSEMPEDFVQKQSPKIEAGNTYQSDNFEKFQSLLKKYEISLQYRYDFTDILTTNQEINNSQNLGKLIEKNLNKQRVARQEEFERRSQEKHAAKFKENLKRKQIIG